MSAQLIARDLTFAHGPETVLDGVSVRLAPGRRVGIVGPNGIGKSTLLRLLAGTLLPASGSIERIPPDAAVGLLHQEIDATEDETIEAFIARRTGVAAADAALDAATTSLSDDPDSGERYNQALDLWLRLGGDDLDARIDTTLLTVGLGVDRRPQAISTLSGGERARAGLAALLLSRFDVLLLDEPTNDLDLAGLDQLEAYVVSSPAAVAVVSHDRRFLERVVTDVLEIDEHRRTSTEHGGGWSAYLAARSTDRRHAEERHAVYVDQRDQLKTRAQRERQWATTGVAKENKKKDQDNDKIGRKMRVEKTEQLAGRASRTQRALERLDVVDKPWEGWELRFSIASAGHQGDLVAELVDAVIEHNSTFTLGPITLTIAAGERVAITGPNGAGKSTLLAAMLGDLPLTDGSRRLGPSVVIGRLDQGRAGFDDGRPLIDAYVDHVGASLEDSRSLLAKFGLGAEHVQRPTSALSPGERTRATLATFQQRGVNLLVLDEPTNHLDLPAIEQVEQALASYDGTMLVVSHDRAFLDALSFTRRIEVVAGRIAADEPV